MIVTENHKRKVREEDWVCSEPLCGNINFYYRKNCNKCGTGRNEYVPALVKVIGKKAAAKSQGIFKDQDWQCNGCGNVNWARRQKCNKCHTDKFDEINIIGGEEGLVEDSVEATEEPSEPTPGTSGASGNSAKIDGIFYKKARIPTQETEKSESADQSQQDWLCKNCGNVSWPRKDTCECCHAVFFDISSVPNVSYYDAVTDDDSEDEINETSRTRSDEFRQEVMDPEKTLESLERQMGTRCFHWLSNLVFQFVDRDSILNGIVPNDRGTVEEILLALILGSLATATSENMPGSSELDNLTNEEKLRLLLRRCDLPDGVRRVLPHLPIREVRENLLQSLTSYLLTLTRRRY